MPTLFLLYFFRLFCSTMETLKDILLSELEKLTVPLQIRIIEVSTKRGKSGLHIKVVIDKDNGVTVHDCEKISRLYNDRLEILETVEEENYTLEVSSPGIQRVLKEKSEYNLFHSRRVKVILKEPLNKGSHDTILTGKLEGIAHDIVTLIVDGKKLGIPVDKINKTRLDG